VYKSPQTKSQIKTEGHRESMGRDRFKTLKGEGDGQNLKFAIIISRFNQTITDALLEGAVQVLEKEGTLSDDITIAEVPGAFEIPGVAKQLALLGDFDALICLGAVIQGETPHFDYICREVSHGIAQLSLELDIPVIFGVLSTLNIEQAIARSNEHNNKGVEAALAAIEMVHLYEKIN